MTPSGTRMAPEFVSEPEPKVAHITLDEVLNVAGRNSTDPLCMSLGPLKGSGGDTFAALVVAQDASGKLLAVWTSESMFGSSDAAQEHAEDVIGSEIWPLFATGCPTW